ncbi:hypothetical protein BEK98_37375 [Streptomyces diastatochromogenes]|uniref:Uncharacterized protein n=1 Tax=Streptomyces diastatochromogenes TaxID=42236 RepID=A0A233S1Z7_STRDA|nr:hypothetical protein BEK98_37375 [Streptomyces diastatochromogenes]
MAGSLLLIMELLTFCDPGSRLMPVVPASIIDPIRAEFLALLPDREVDHRLGCHNPPIPDAIVFGKLITALGLGKGYKRVADGICLAATIQRRRDEWIEAGVADGLAGKGSMPVDHEQGHLDSLSDRRCFGGCCRRRHHGHTAHSGGNPASGSHRLRLRLPQRPRQVRYDNAHAAERWA